MTVEAGPAVNCVSRIAERVKASHDPSNSFREVLLALEGSERIQLLIEVFERVCDTCVVQNYWAFAIAARAYSALQDHKAAFAIACHARNIEPDGGAGWFLNEILYHHFLQSNRPREAVAICLTNLERFPALPFTTEDDLDELMSSAGIARMTQHLEQKSAPMALERTIVLEASCREAWTCQMAFGSALPLAVAAMSRIEARPPVEVVKLTDVEILVIDNQIAVLDRNGQTLPEFSVAGFPSSVVRVFQKIKESGGAFHDAKVDRAILLSDGWPSPNYCHFLLDQIGRQVFYRAAIGSLDGLVSIGPQLITAWQREIAEKFSVQNYIHTAQVIRITASQLWVSSDCRNTLHHAYAGARIITDFVRDTIRPQTDGVPRRLYVSRNDGVSRRIANEDEVLSLLQKYGFTRIFPGQMSVQQQADIFASATHIVGPHGANMTSVIFAAPGTHVMEIFHPLYSNAAFTRLAPVLGLHYAAMTGTDGSSDLSQFNKPSDGPALAFVPSHTRSIKVDPGELIRWLDSTGGRAL